MSTLYIPIGISGSGKTTYGNKLKAKVVCPDDIRKEVNGSISDQSNSGKVFSIYEKRMADLASKGKDVFASMTHLKYSYIKNTINAYKSATPFKVVFILFEDSLDWKKCYNRIKNDLGNGVDRSDVPEDVIRNQVERYKLVRSLVLKAKPSDFKNVESIEIIKV